MSSKIILAVIALSLASLALGLNIGMMVGKHLKDDD